MCGIFGIVVSKSSRLEHHDIARLISDLFSLSESRGSEAAGIAISTEQEIVSFKRAMRATKMLKTQEYIDYLRQSLSSWRRDGGLSIIGHSRLVTNGTQGVDDNNQPVASRHCVGVHNGIVVNDNDVWRKHPDITREHEVDTEVIYRLIDKFREAGSIWQAAIAQTYAELEGEANIAFIQDSDPVFAAATNVGSAYFVEVREAGVFLFASEAHFLRRLLASPPIRKAASGNNHVVQLKPGTGIIVDTETLEQKTFLLSDQPVGAQPLTPRKSMVDRSPRRVSLRRCTQCILPHTFPFITFDEHGVCSICQEARPVSGDSLHTLEQRIAPYRRADGAPDCIVALSGGRDSCYGLHVIKKELGLNPVAYTYDWAMVTDEARRNCAKVCGQLGVEHIIRSADILAKRRNIRMNVEAWLRRPELGMIPLFMAGDKQFFHYATQVSKQTEIPLVIFCGGNNLEITRFKTGFCGVKDQSTNTMVGLDNRGKLKLLAYYAKNYLLNPAYLNRSIFDTLFAFYSTYVGRQDFLYLYRYYPWDEKAIETTLRDQYGWEGSGDSKSTWRIGDGTASFYNYIYHTVAGFSEHDTFRSNQIRAGLITRSQALELAAAENRPRYESMREYAQLVGFNLDEALTVINQIPKLS
ncbi:MAG: hypothetical protein RBS35_02240 [Azonexus sp.]|jgi:hypothetical protein|nr:hypothetical protein [Azonexus sp.]